MSERTIGIIGCGPRGLAALESLTRHITEMNAWPAFRIRLFDGSGYPGAGPNHAPDQLVHNRINLAENEMDLPEREMIRVMDQDIPSFPSYKQWAEVNDDPERPDTYPPRAHLGTYLHERFESIAEPLMTMGLLTFIHEYVQHISFPENKIRISTNSTRSLCDELLLTPGHVPVNPDKQLTDWIRTGTGHRLFLAGSPYPIEKYLNTLLRNHSRIAVRGFGLTFLDIASAIGNACGKFSMSDKEQLKVSFSLSGDHPLIIPFSVDGLPPVPKPLNQSEYQKYSPGNKSLEILRHELKHEMTDSGNFLSFFRKRMADIIAAVYEKLRSDCPENADIFIRSYLEEERYNHPQFTNHSRPVAEIMEEFCGIACGQILPTLDYCVGQVWRHCREVMYDLFDHPPLEDDVMYEIIQLDERLKRYTYGPPLISIRELLAMHEKGVVSLDWIDDPEIRMDRSGWRLSSTKGEILTTAMINGVLSPPDISSVNSSVINQIREKCPVEQFFDLGARTDSQGLVRGCERPVAILGRLAKGRILGSDSIRECFNDEPVRWAAGVLNRNAKTS